MTFVERLKNWVQAMEDVEEPMGAELSRLLERVKVLEAYAADPSVEDKSIPG